MNRPIKFRAWDYEENVMLGWEDIKLFSAFVLSQSSKGRYFMQFTGLLDKNGKEIYESDKIVQPNNFGGESYVVEWRDGRFNISEKEDDLSVLAEVVGNIYES